ncbi:hypothetical protein C8046_12260 [Serinibacter arcticus]|uniref:HTH tetR-type domain-containing protein n=1 Tax=Serinibacter arcticus TaxID=1655435 RepID=A0A2U1ZWG2_9MICO|nr:TetR/AcrR family transcriptional regulator [Serinibacter arcticus]PWD51318.1 hypothetical protein C8046_12260 [Serinibacter arcticus]
MADPVSVDAEVTLGPRARARRDSIALHTLSCVRENGWDATTIDHIVVAAGASRRTFFNYFKTKADAFWYAAQMGQADLLAQVRSAGATSDPWGAVVTAQVSWAHQVEKRGRQGLQALIEMIDSVDELNRSVPVHELLWVDEVSHVLTAPDHSPQARAATRAAASSFNEARNQVTRLWAREEIDDLAEAMDDVLSALSRGAQQAAASLA